MNRQHRDDTNRSHDRAIAERLERDTSQDPHHPLNQPASDPSPDEWPDPYDRRPDPRAPVDEEGGPRPDGAISTSEPHPRQDPEAAKRVPRKRRELRNEKKRGS